MSADRQPREGNATVGTPLAALRFAMKARNVEYRVDVMARELQSGRSCPRRNPIHGTRTMTTLPRIRVGSSLFNSCEEPGRTLRKAARLRSPYSHETLPNSRHEADRNIVSPSAGRCSHTHRDLPDSRPELGREMLKPNSTQLRDVRQEPPNKGLHADEGRAIAHRTRSRVGYVPACRTPVAPASAGEAQGVRRMKPRQRRIGC